MMRALALLLLMVLAVPARAAEQTIRVANAAPSSFFYTALYVGKEKGIFKANGLSVQDVQVFGGAKGMFALASGSVDIDLGAGPEFASIAKGKAGDKIGRAHV